MNTPDHKTGEIVLSGLPFQGSVPVGKKGFFTGEQVELKNMLDDWADRQVPHDLID